MESQKSATIFREFSQIRFLTKLYDILKNQYVTCQYSLLTNWPFIWLNQESILFYRENRIIEISLAKLFFAFVVMKWIF